MDKGIHFLHNHPKTEALLKLKTDHVIVDRDAWIKVREEYLTKGTIPSIVDDFKKMRDELTMLKVCWQELLYRFWRRDSASCPLEAKEQELEEEMFRKWVSELDL